MATAADPVLTRLRAALDKVIQKATHFVGCIMERLQTFGT